jgi:hypothetical protein
MRPLFLVAAAVLTPLPALSQMVQSCQDSGYIVSPANLVEPWSLHSRTYANGAIRLALLDTGGEPGCCAAHLLVLSPAGGRDEPEYRACHVVSAQPGLGFYSIDVPGIAASYDPTRGLALDVPVRHWDQSVETGGAGTLGRFLLRIDQAAQTVTLD